MISTKQKQSWQQIFLLGLMVVNALLLIGLVWQVHQNQAKQQTTLEAVLSDYGHLSAEQLLRNFKSQLGYNALYQLSQLWSHEGNPTSSIQEYLNSNNTDLSQVQAIIQQSITNIQLFDVKKNSIHNINHPKLNSDTHPIPSFNAGDAHGFKALHQSNPNDLSFRSLIQINSKYAVVVSYHDSLARTLLMQIINTQNLLPTTLADNFGNTGLGFRLNDANGQPLWQRYWNPGIESPILIVDGEYGGLFEGYQLMAVIDDSLASRLIIGGLPESQTPKLMLLLCLALLAMAIMFWLHKRAAQLNRQQSLFLARASHELKTPLTQIRLFAETLELDRLKDEQLKNHCLTVIHQESIRLGQIVDNILHHQSSQQSEPVPKQLNKSKVTLQLFFEKLLQQQSILWKHNDITVSLNIDAEHTVDTDANLLKQVMINLLDNAVKFGPKKQTLTIETFIKTNAIQIKITDQGPGIQSNLIPLSLSSFQRLKRDEERGINGNGLGLSISQQLIHHLGGRLSFEHPKVGLTAVISLPFQTVNLKDEMA